MKLAILWDVDGTLADSEPLHDEAAIAVLRSFGVKATLSQQLLGCARKEVHAYYAASYQGVPDFDIYAAAIDSYYIANVVQVNPNPDAADACRRFASEGREQMAVSNSTPSIVDATLRNIKLNELLQGVISCDGKGRPKPAPDPYRRALDRLGLQPDQAIVYEDSKVGCQSARAAGLFVVGITADDEDIGAHVHYPKVPTATPETIIEAYRENSDGR